MIKRVIIVISAAIIVGFIIFNVTDNKKFHVEQIVIPKSFQKTQGLSPTPAVLPTLPPLDPNSNLEQETDNLNPRDFSEDFQNLRNSI